MTLFGRWHRRRKAIEAYYESIRDKPWYLVKINPERIVLIRRTK